MTKRCVWCDWEFVTNRSDKIYCTEACRDDATRDRKMWAQRRRRRFLSEELRTMAPPPSRPFLFCRHGDCQKCPGIVAGQFCPCGHHKKAAA